jgi:hypothetical protein
VKFPAEGALELLSGKCVSVDEGHMWSRSRPAFQKNDPPDRARDPSDSSNCPTGSAGTPESQPAAWSGPPRQSGPLHRGPAPCLTEVVKSSETVGLGSL